jgi:acyl transferase domain-containing protein/NADPH:quinone reductase-like Zn-dependent oxidoreductase/NADP-dependent 3-hydroxy acid dehydrogenase YdfG/acyl carrier protein
MKPLAIVGMGCRFPGGADSPEALWRLLRDGVDAVVPVPAERWSLARFHDPDPDVPGRSYVREAGFLQESIFDFDAGFWGIAPREAAQMDPQQRLLLEVAWEAVQDARRPVEALRGAAVGVFVGGFALGNLVERFGPLNRRAMDASTTTTATMTMLSNRLSYLLDLRGPSMTVDTACSSSLTAFHLACQAIWRGECDHALAGGTSVMLRPEYFLTMCKGGFLSPDGRCKSFDARADGYGRGEGAGMVLVEPLDAALARGARVYAVVHATAANQDGRTRGLTLPSQRAQTQLLSRLLQGHDPAQVRYVEAHGTGTQAGDPVELGTLRDVLGRPDDPVWVGSVKTNIGHLEAAAGVAGVIKAALVLHHQTVPPNLHFETPNPEIDFSGLQVATACAPIDPGLAVVNSFGYGGANAQALLGPAPAPVESTPSPGPWLLRVSGHTDDALAHAVERLPSVHPAGLADSLSRRSALRCRQAVLVREPGRRAWVQGRAPAASRRVVLAFTGMGTQSWGMGAQLYRSEPVFRAAVDPAAERFEALGLDVRARLGWTTDAPAHPVGHVMGEPADAQPGNLLIQLGLHALLRHHGVRPVAVFGHSAGEVAAAVAAGALSVRDAVQVTWHRSQLQQEALHAGGMLAVGLSAEDLAPHLVPGLEIAAFNGPTLHAVSGDRDALGELRAKLEGQGVLARPVRVDVAYHSAHMQPGHARFLERLADLSPQPPGTPLWSTTLGARVTDAPLDAAYWWRNNRQPVQLQAVVQGLVDQGVDAVIEVGPHPALALGIRETAGRADVVVLPSLRRGVPEQDAIDHAVARAWCEGVPLSRGDAGPHVALAPLAWQRERLWAETPATQRDKHGTFEHPLLHQSLAGPEPAWSIELDPGCAGYVSDHVVTGQVVVPGAVLAEIALAAAGATERPVRLADLVFERAVVGAHTQLQVSVTHDGALRIDQDTGGWSKVATARLSRMRAPAPARVDLDRLRAAHDIPVDIGEIYGALRGRGLDFGPRIRALRELATGPSGWLARVELHPADRPDQARHHVHPVLLDACFQGLAGLLLDGQQTLLPHRMDALEIHGGPWSGAGWVWGRLVRQQGGRAWVDATLVDADGGVRAVVRGLELRPLPQAKAQTLTTQSWIRAQDAGWPEPPTGRWHVVGSGEVADALQDQGASLAQGALEPGDTLVFCANGDPLAAAQAFLAAVQHAPSGAAVVLVTRGLFQDAQLSGAGCWNLRRALAAERPDLRTRAIDVHDTPADTLVDALLTPTREAESRWIGETQWVPRQRPGVDPRSFPVVPMSPDLPAVLASGAGLDGLHWVQSRRRPPGPGQVELRVHATPLNFKDLMKALDLLDDDYLDRTWAGRGLGLEAAGVVTRVGAGVDHLRVGDRALIAAPGGTMRTWLTGDARHMWRIPERLDFAQAGCLTPYLTAHHALIDLARAEHGESVLIHSAAGGVGTALAAISGLLGLRVHATAGTPAKRAWLREQGIEHVYDSRSERFLSELHDATGGAGVDVIVAAVDGEMLETTARCLADYGRFVDIGRHNDPRDVARVVLERRGQLIGLDIDCLTRDRPRRFQALAHAVLERLETGEYPALPTTRFSSASAPDAFRAMGRAAYIGKLALVHDAPLPVRAGHQPDPEYGGRHVVTGGLTGLGAQVARWLAVQGATQLDLVSRRGAQTPGAQALAASMPAVRVRCLSVDVSDADAVQALIADGSPVRGVFHAAMVLDDAPIHELTAERLAGVWAPKAAGAWALHRACPDVEHFVLFSSIAAVVGNPGQSAYAAANGFCDALARHRRGQGQAGQSIQWGVLGQVGVVARDAELHARLVERGLRPLSTDDALDLLDETLRAGPPVALAADVDWGRLLTGPGRTPRFQELASSTDGGATPPLVALLPTLDPALRADAVVSALAELVGVVMGQAAEQVASDQALDTLGVDSLMATEIAGALQTLSGVQLAGAALLSGQSLQQLADHVLDQMERP